MVGEYERRWRCRICQKPRVVQTLVRDCEERCAAELGLTVEEFLELHPEIPKNL